MKKPDEKRYSIVPMLPFHSTWQDRMQQEVEAVDRLNKKLAESRDRSLKKQAAEQEVRDEIQKGILDVLRAGAETRRRYFVYSALLTGIVIVISAVTLWAIYFKH
jgi:ABC-type bacteriocin/lantibiotic exporter with double-glycine peptidase domain